MARGVGTGYLAAGHEKNFCPAKTVKEERMFPFANTHDKDAKPNIVKKNFKDENG
jgi:hypothetical protein